MIRHRRVTRPRPTTTNDSALAHLPVAYWNHRDMATPSFASFPERPKPTDPSEATSKPAAVQVLREDARDRRRDGSDRNTKSSSDHRSHSHDRHGHKHRRHESERHTHEHDDRKDGHRPKQRDADESSRKRRRVQTTKPQKHEVAIVSLERVIPGYDTYSSSSFASSLPPLRKAFPESGTRTSPATRGTYGTAGYPGPRWRNTGCQGVWFTPLPKAIHQLTCAVQRASFSAFRFICGCSKTRRIMSGTGCAWLTIH